MSEEEAAELRYEAGMYHSLYELAKERNAKLVAALRAAETYLLQFTELDLDRDVVLRNIDEAFTSSLQRNHEPRTGKIDRMGTRLRNDGSRD